MPRACGMLVCFCGFVEKIIKKRNHMEKNCYNPQCFQGKNYKAKFLTSLILKNKIGKENFEKNHNKKK
jgi:hypothetical protein